MPDILSEKRPDGVAVITFNRPDRLNAFSDELIEGLASALAAYASDPEVRCLALTGTGRAFCAGGDVKAMVEDVRAVTAGGDTDEEAAASLAQVEEATSEALHSMPKPTVALVNGFAMGAGFSLALACDIRLCSDQARLGTAFRNVALSGDFGGAYFLPRLIGAGHARELYFTGEIIDAKRALELGLVNRVIPHDDLMTEGLAFCAKLAAGPTRALGRMKANLNAAEGSPLTQVLRQEALNQRFSSLDEDHRSAARAFVEKKEPVFQGR